MILLCGLTGACRPKTPSPPDDARALEAVYQAALDASDARRPEGPASASDLHTEDCPVAPAQDVANAMGQSKPKTKTAAGG